MLRQSAILIFLIFSLFSENVYNNLPISDIFIVYNHNADSFALKTSIVDRFEEVFTEMLRQAAICKMLRQAADLI